MSFTCLKKKLYFERIRRSTSRYYYLLWKETSEMKKSQQSHRKNAEKNKQKFLMLYLFVVVTMIIFRESVSRGSYWNFRQCIDRRFVDLTFLSFVFAQERVGERNASVYLDWFFSVCGKLYLLQMLQLGCFTGKFLEIQFPFPDFDKMILTCFQFLSFIFIKQTLLNFRIARIFTFITTM